MEDWKLEDQIWDAVRRRKMEDQLSFFVRIIAIKLLHTKNSNIMNCLQNSMQKVRKQFNNTTETHPQLCAICTHNKSVYEELLMHNDRRDIVVILLDGVNKYIVVCHVERRKCSDVGTRQRPDHTMS